MAALKVPSLQHLARNWKESPHLVQRKLVELAHNSPSFNYDPLFGVVEDMLIFKQPYEQIVEGIKRAIGRPGVRDNFLGVLPLLRDHFENIRPRFVQSVSRRYYSVGRNLMVPFDPPLIYGDGERIHFPWFSFWRSYPIRDERLSLFVSVVQELLEQDPDLEKCKFVILDFSVPKSQHARTLRVIDASDVPRLSESKKDEMLATFAEGYWLAVAELKSEAGKGFGRDKQDGPETDGPGLFDPDPDKL
jgi:hypothetical protein